MQIDQITISLRPRSTWESIDLGFGLARKLWSRLLFSWIVLALPVFVISMIIFHDRPYIAIWIFWWCKPAYEQLPLYFISRAIFNDIADRKQLVRKLPSVVFRQLIPILTWRRISFNRSYTAPVAQLEGLSGTKRSARIRVLSESRNVGGWLTVICMHLEAVIYFSLFALVWLMVPFEVDIVEWVNDNKQMATVGLNILYFIAVAVIAPFYVVSGFSLYLNRRTHLEGWDIELAFKRMREKYSSSIRNRAAAAVILLLSSMAVFSIPDAAQAAEDDQATVTTATSEPTATTEAGVSNTLVSREQAQTIIKKVMDHKAFGEKKKEKVWRLKDKFKNDKEQEEKRNIDTSFFANLVLLLADIGYYLMWIGVALLVVFIIYQFPKWKTALDLGGMKRTAKPASKPDVLFGLEISEESLPENIPEEAWKLFSNRQPRQALSLLYRGSLSVLINRYGLIVRESDTEGECSEKVRKYHETSAEFFARLTRVWVFMAYGHRLPSQEDMQYLCKDWNVYFGDSAQ